LEDLPPTTYVHNSNKINDQWWTTNQKMI